jgi:NAD-dependent SIR2 family protein deacetylase
VQDFKQCDLLVVMGTSLAVHPFAGLVDRVSSRCPRLLINRDEVRWRQRQAMESDAADAVVVQVNKVDASLQKEVEFKLSASHSLE